MVDILDNKLPSAIKNWHFFTQKIQDKKIILFLDYDGTLVSIAEKPELATIPNDKKNKLDKLSQLYLTAIVSGRRLSEQIDLIGKENFYYICHHGYDIKIPCSNAFNLQKFAEFKTDINEVYHQLQATLGKIKGILIENKKYSLSIHFRLVERELVEYIETSIDNIIENQFRLRKHYAKKVFEIRPNVQWDTGHAITWLVNELNLQKETIFPIYIGDDVTDEPGFKTVNKYGTSIIVGEYYRPTLARYNLKNVSEVWAFLNKLIDASSANKPAPF